MKRRTLSALDLQVAADIYKRIRGDEAPIPQPKPKISTDPKIERLKVITAEIEEALLVSKDAAMIAATNFVLLEEMKKRPGT